MREGREKKKQVEEENMRKRERMNEQMNEKRRQKIKK